MKPKEATASLGPGLLASSSKMRQGYKKECTWSEYTDKSQPHISRRLPELHE
ncbi:MAG TPA: hypothetical protein VFI73_06165 [Candidatus Nitrosopolaris sp.]|nr:hypothetical protein [Candidatus Nitrosopolaris sp.]